MAGCGSDKLAICGEENRVYMCIDLKSFYASVECVERGLDPFTTNLVVADPERTDKTICLAVSPAMKKLGDIARVLADKLPEGVNVTKLLDIAEDSIVFLILSCRKGSNKYILRRAVV